MKKQLFTLFILISGFLYSQETDIVLSISQNSVSDVEATNSITLLPGFNTNGYMFSAKIVPENIYDVVVGNPYKGNEALNWVSSASYDLSGNLTSSGVSYFNTLGKPTQSHSLDIKTGKIWVNEVRYDAYGRPVLSTLSAPIGTQYGYKSNFISTKSGDTFSKSNLESIQNNNTPEIIGNQENTLGWYYSENNNSEKYQDITAHPYSKTIFSTLNPGIGLRNLGGNKIKKTADSTPEWLQSYSFSMPMAQELFYEFEPDYFPKRDKIPQGKFEFLRESLSGKYIYMTYDLKSCKDGTEYTDVSILQDYLLKENTVYEFRNLNGVNNGITDTRIGFYKVTRLIRHKREGNGITPGGNDNENKNIFALRTNTAYADCHLENPYYLKGKKTIVRDVHGVESVVFTDSEGNVLAAARSGDEDGDKPKRKVISPINKQGYVDIHIPVGCGSTVDFLGYPGARYKIYNLVTEAIQSSYVYGAGVSLPSGSYRIEETTDYHKTYTTHVTLDDNGVPQLLESNKGVAVKYKVNYYDFSLNYYDKANRLIKSTQPISKNLASTFKYNTLGQLLETTSPDEGKAVFKYRNDGQIRFSQNSKQEDDNEFSYTNYDNFGRPIESGVATGNYTTLNANEIVFTGIKKEQHFTVYDEVDFNLNNILTTAGLPTEPYKQKFVTGNVSKTYTQNPSTTTTWYNYDVYGRVKSIVQNIDGLGIKTIDYEYDFSKGQVTKVIYQKYKPIETFAHKYEYNIAGELFKVYTSTDNNYFKEQAKYKYYETGALKRVEIASDVQGLDYIYNLNGQLKAINHPSRSSKLDPGNDGNNGMPTDLFGFAIDYYNGDYSRTNTPTPVTSNNAFVKKNQYNGNIKATRWSNQNIDNGAQASKLFSYNKNNWLQEATFGTATNNGVITPNTGGNYKVSGLTYDANGNIQSLDRKKNYENGSNRMDELRYVYKTNKPNQLKRVNDLVTIATNAYDIKDQTTDDNYQYNTIGQLTENIDEKVRYEYNASGLVTKVLKNNKVRVAFDYNDKGHRVKKTTYTNTESLETETYYVRDAAGSPMAIITPKTGITNKETSEYPIYGASRLGVYNKTAGSATYQLTDHLGNVRATVVKTNRNEVLTASGNATDYYPFGMPMPNRINGANSYRYAYQGQEKDDETGKEAFQLRLWDGRIGRWLTTDPKGQYGSSYLGIGNNPVNSVDPDGGYVYVMGGDSDLQKIVLKVLIAKLGRETVEWFAKNPHNHIHIGWSDGETIDVKTGKVTGGHYGMTMGSNGGILSDSDSYITESDVRKVHGKRIASHYLPYYNGARKDKGRNWYVLLDGFKEDPDGSDETLFHEIRAHIYTPLFLGTRSGEEDHMIYSNQNNGHINTKIRPFENFPAYNYIYDREYSTFNLKSMMNMFQFQNMGKNDSNTKLKTRIPKSF